MNYTEKKKGDLYLKKAVVHQIYLPLSASFLLRKQWKYNTLQQSCDPGHKMTNNRSHPQSHLWWRVPDHWTAMKACQTAQYFLACCHQSCCKREKKVVKWCYDNWHDASYSVIRRGLTWYMNICYCFCYTTVSQSAVKTRVCPMIKKNLNEKFLTNNLRKFTYHKNKQKTKM